jgi:hypothetical protein
MSYTAAVEAVDAVAVGARQLNDKSQRVLYVSRDRLTQRSRPTTEKVKAYCDLVALKDLTAKGYDSHTDTVPKEENRLWSYHNRLSE